MASPSPSPAQQPQQMETVEMTIVSGKHLKNVNWRNGGELKPYAIAYLDKGDHRRFATKPDDCGSTRPVWNEKFTFLLPRSTATDLTVEVFHSKPSETPKPLVGSVRVPLHDLLPADHSPVIRTLDLLRPSGRPQGKLRLKLSVLKPPPPDYYSPPLPPAASLSPPPPSYYSQQQQQPPPPSRPLSNVPPPTYRDYPSYHYPNVMPPRYQYGDYSDPYFNPYPTGGYYSAPPAPSRTMQMMPPAYERPYIYGGGPGGPSAPYDHSSSSSSSEQKPRGGGRMGFGTGLAVGAIAGAIGGLALEEGIKREEEKVTEKVEADLAARDAYSDYRAEY